MSDNKYVSYLRSGVHRHVDNHKCADYIEQLQGAIKKHQSIIHKKLANFTKDHCPEDKELWSVLAPPKEVRRE